MDIPDTKYNEKLTNHLISRVMDIGDRSMMRFKFDDFEAEFLPFHFFLLTGLKFGPSVVLPEKSYFHDRSFGGQKIIYVGNIHTRFLYECQNYGGSSVDSFNLGMIFFLYGVILNPEGRFTAPVDLRFMHAVDNIDTFNAYPWGMEAYSFLLNSVYDVVEGTSEPAMCQKYQMIEIGGLSIAIQLWAFESFPDMAINSSFHDCGHIEVFPRMITKWIENDAYVEAITSSQRIHGSMKYVS